ncbi:MAG: agmatine deiminase family protein [Pirellulaceae bacterium]
MRHLGFCGVCLTLVVGAALAANEPPASLPPVADSAGGLDRGAFDPRFSDPNAPFGRERAFPHRIELPPGIPFGGGLPANVVPPPAGVRLPGEFENQEMILLAYNDLVSIYPDLFLELAKTLRGKTRVAVLVDAGQSQFIDELLAEHDLVGLQIDRIEVPHDTMWVRDYGPIVVKGKAGRRTAVDADYLQFGRPLDDAVPSLMAGPRKLDVVAMNIDLEGGNLLSNGDGLLLSTTTVLEVNRAQGRDDGDVVEFFRQFFGGQVEFLEPLDSEATGHVDMFATFTAPDTVLVGAYDPEDDPINAEVLDRNAARLARLTLSDGRKLRVVRIPMPKNDDGVWRTYTNVVMANGVVLVPSYPDIDPAVDRNALATFRSLMPAWQVKPIDVSEVIGTGGALHCMTRNIPAEDDAPAAGATPSEPRSRRIVERLSRRRPRLLPPTPAG